MTKSHFDNSFTAEDCNKLWEQLSSTLNRLEGARKSTRGWRKCWRDLRRNTKEKVAKLRQLGPTLMDDLTPIQQKVRALIEDNDATKVTVKTEPELDHLWQNVDVNETVPVIQPKPFRRKLRSFAERKLCMKRSYYNRKLALLERHIQAIDRQTDAINKQTVVHERLMQLLNLKQI